MHSTTIGDSLRQHACRQHQSRARRNASGPAANPDIYVGVERPDEPGHTDIDRTIALYSYLNERMTVNYPWTDAETPYNPTIASGYTYLGQLASHDLFLSDSTAPSLRDPSKAKNERGRPLVLETLYGRTPELDPQVFERAPDQTAIRFAHWPRTRFRLDGVGLAVNDWSRDSSRCPRRDIGRIRDVRFGQEYGCPLVTDDRNDDHAIISQLTALFQLAHNTAMDLIEWSEKPSSPLDSANNFSTARSALTFVYREIVRQDLLARLLDPAIRAHYEGSDDPDRFIMNPSAGSVLTPDFLNAAYRMGHAMVRAEYGFSRNDRHNLPEILRNSSFRAPGRTPLRKPWIVRWSEFFRIEGADREPQLARRISPKYVAALHDRNLFETENSSEPGGLAYRDILRAATTGVMKVDALADLICRKAPALAEQSPWFSDSDCRKAALEEWFGDDAPEESDGFRNEFVSNPPPNVYYLIEAAMSARGEHLGPIGSVVLGETFYRALDDSSEHEQLRSAAIEIFGTRPPATMAELITWIDDNMRTEDKVFEDRPLPLI